MRAKPLACGRIPSDVVMAFAVGPLSRALAATRFLTRSLQKATAAENSLDENLFGVTTSYTSLSIPLCKGILTIPGELVLIFGPGLVQESENVYVLTACERQEKNGRIVFPLNGRCKKMRAFLPFSIGKPDCPLPSDSVGQRMPVTHRVLDSASEYPVIEVAQDS